MTLVHWPRSALIKPRTMRLDMMPRSVSGAPSLAGQSQAVASDAGVWGITYTGVLVRKAAGVLLWRALEAQIQGRINAIVLPVFERPSRTPTASLLPSVELLAQDVEHEDGTTHSDGAGYAASGGLQATVVGAVAAGAVAWTLDVAGAVPLEPGMHFSVGHRLYRVASITSTAGTQSTIKAWPPARDAVLAGSVAELADLVCKVRLATDREMAGEMIEANRHQEVPAVNFIEDLR